MHEEEGRLYQVTLCDENGDDAGEVRLYRGEDGKVHFETDGLVPARGAGPRRVRLIAEDDVPGLVWALGAEPNARFKEAISWRLMSELARRHPGHLRVAEMHGGGGQYDELRLYPRPTPREAPFFFSLNRSGSAHFGRVEQPAWRGIWSDCVGAPELKDIVDKLEERSGLISSSDHAPGSPLLPPTPDVLTVRAIALLLAPKAFERERWTCRSGYFDSSGMGGSGVNTRWFDAFPLCRARLDQRAPDDLCDEPAYRFWFILRDDEPRLAFEDDGLVWDRHGEQLNLVARRKSAGSLGRVVPELAARL